MSQTLPDGVQALRNALETTPDDVTVTLSLTRRSAEMVLELLEVEHSSGAVIVPVKSLLTSTEAAAMLGMSRPTLMKLVDAGAVEHIYVGTHRRIPIQSLVDYQRRRQSEHNDAVVAASEFRSNISFGGDK